MKLNLLYALPFALMGTKTYALNLRSLKSEGLFGIRDKLSSVRDNVSEKGRSVRDSVSEKLENAGINKELFMEKFKESGLKEKLQNGAKKGFQIKFQDQVKEMEDDEQFKEMLERKAKEKFDDHDAQEEFLKAAMDSVYEVIEAELDTELEEPEFYAKLANMFKQLDMNDEWYAYYFNNKEFEEQLEDQAEEEFEKELYFNNKEDEELEETEEEAEEEFKEQSEETEEEAEGEEDESEEQLEEEAEFEEQLEDQAEEEFEKELEEYEE